MYNEQRTMILGRLEKALKTIWNAEKDPDGNYYVKVPAGEYESDHFVFQEAYDQRYEPDVIERLFMKIDEKYYCHICAFEKELLMCANLEQDSGFYEEALKILRGKVFFYLDYESILKMPVSVNLMIKANGEHMNNGLKWLVEQQGYTYDEFKETLSDYDLVFSENPRVGVDELTEVFIKSHSKFLTSACLEIYNQKCPRSCLTVPVRMTLRDAVEIFSKDDSGKCVLKEFVFPKDTMVGLFNPWEGSGGYWEIELEKDLVIPSNVIYDYQIEEARFVDGYTVNYIYDLYENQRAEPIKINKN